MSMRVAACLVLVTLDAGVNALAVSACTCELGNCIILQDPFDLHPQMCLREVHQDKFVVGTIMRDGIWEPKVTHKLLTEIRDGGSSGAAATIFLDIGAHLGHFTLLAHAAGVKQAVSFEANIESVKFLRSSLRANKFSTGGLHHALLWSSADERFSLDGGGGNTGGWQVKRNPDGDLVSKTVDSILEEHHPSILGPSADGSIVMKVDVEGSEPHVLRGATKALGAARAVFMEWGSGGEEKSDLVKWLVSLGLKTDDCSGDFRKCNYNMVFRR